MKFVIGVCGTTASGKDTVGAYIAEKLDIPIFECSKPVIEETKKRGLPLKREEIMKVGSELAARIGPGFPVGIFLKEIKDFGVITSIRAPVNVDYLRKNSKLILIAVDANSKLRFQRAKERKKLDDNASLGDFEGLEEKEAILGQMNVRKCMQMADYKIDNNSDIESLGKKVDGILMKEKLEKVIKIHKSFLPKKSG